MGNQLLVHVNWKGVYLQWRGCSQGAITQECQVQEADVVSSDRFSDDSPPDDSSDELDSDDIVAYDMKTSHYTSLANQTRREKRDFRRAHKRDRRTR